MTGEAVKYKFETKMKNESAMKELKIVMLPPLTEVYRQWGRRLAQEFPEVEIIVAESAAEAELNIADADGAIGQLSPGMLAKARKLRWLQSHYAAPPTGYYFQELIDHPVIVTNMREIFNDHIGAHVMAFVLAFARGLSYYIPRQLRREWQPEPHDTGIIHLPETTMLVVGLGGIGAETARLASCFGVKVIATDARRTVPTIGVAELYPAQDLDSLLPQADFVVLTVPHTPATEGMMNKERFARMKRGAFFINIGRGKTTKLDALVEALRAGQIAGAGLDVFEVEPLPDDHALWTMPNVLITPHMAGYGPYLDERRFDIIRANCRALINGSPFKNVVDKSAWF
jgi:phosphoglycerate dehydrogenase-like enzyme